MQDQLSAKLIECPECRTWAHTRPVEGVPEQALRNCDACGHDYFIDYAVTPFRDPGPTTTRKDHRHGHHP